MLPLDLDALPTEIKERVVEHCSNQDLLQLSISNRELWLLGTRYLYRDVPALDYENTAIFLMSVFLSDRSASLVRRLSLDLTHSEFVSDDTVGKLFPYLPRFEKVEGADELKQLLTCLDPPSLIIHVLNKMRRLEHLDLISRDRSRNFLVMLPMFSTLAAANVLKLKSFHTSFDTSLEMYAFLIAQTSLQEFGLWGSNALRKEVTLPSGSLGNVTTLGWAVSYKPDWGAIPNIVKRRIQDQTCQPVTSVVVDLVPLELGMQKFLIGAYLDVGWPAKDWITSATILFAPFMQTSSVRPIVNAFPNLENLRINVENFNTALPGTMIPCVKNLPRLRHLVLYGGCMVGVDMESWKMKYLDRKAQISKGLVSLHVAVFCVHKSGKRAYYRIGRPEPGCAVCAKLCDPNLCLGSARESIF